ncbi:MAG: hypothetical protein QXN37_02195 [Candidatus Anstonellaceae archaeon]
MNGKKKMIYLMYDFDELCGVFSSLDLAKKAVDQHLLHIKNYVQRKSLQLGFGEVDFEIFEEKSENKHIYAVLAKAKNGKDVHRRKIVVFGRQQDTYDSTIKRLSESI